MTDFFRDVWRYLWRRDSESACCLIIGMSNALSDRDVQQMADYFQSLYEYILKCKEQRQ